MWQLKMLFALGAICFELTAVRRIKTEEFQICFWSWDICFPCRLMLDLNLGWPHFPLLGSIPGFWWVMITGRPSLKTSPGFVDVSSGRGKQQLMKMLFVFPAGSPYYDNVRPLSYPDSDAVLICFDISRPETLDSVLKKASVWASPEHRAAGKAHL